MPMTDTKPNAELAYRVLDLTRQHAEHLNMGEWAEGVMKPDGIAKVTLTDLTGPACCTTACFAGWTVALAGHAVSEGGGAWTESGEYLGLAECVAREMLGLTHERAALLFMATDDEYLATRVAEIFGPRPEATV
jgi:hypothetical protein